MSAKLKVVVASLCLIVSIGVVILVLVRSTPANQHPQAHQLRQANAVDGTAVVVAVAAVGRGERITRDQVTLRRIEGPTLGNPLTSLSAAIDAIALNTIQPGQVIIADAVAKGDAARPGLSLLVPDGQRAVALRVNDEIAVGNFVSPGDRVDIQVVFSAKQAAGLPGSASNTPSAEAHVLLQNIEILSAGETLITANDGRAIRMQNITVAVTPRDAQILAVAKETGSFYLALRNPADQEVAALPAVSATALTGIDRGRRAAAPKQIQGTPARRVQVIEGQKSSMRAVQDD